MTGQQLLDKIKAADGSHQNYQILDAQNKSIDFHCCLTDQAQLIVIASDGETKQVYRLISDNHHENGEWNNQEYDLIDRTVAQARPIFPNYHVSINDEPFKKYIRQVREIYAVGNEAHDPAVKDSSLVFSSQIVWYYGDAINKAIQAVSNHGGGYVHVYAHESQNSDGAYYSGSIILKSNVNLVVEKNAEIKFMRNRDNQYYPVTLTSYEGSDLYNYSACVEALGQHNIALSGGGLLNGQEDMWNWRPYKKGYWGEKCVENKDIHASYGCNGILNYQNFNDIPVTKRIFTDNGKVPNELPIFENGQVEYKKLKDAHAMISTFRPNFIEFNHCKNCVIDGIKIRHTPFWAVHPLNSQNILISHVDLYSNRTHDFEDHGWNNDDGIDPESCQYVIMEENQVTVSDDGVAIKAGRNRDGMLRRQPCSKLIIRHSIYNNDGGGSAAISIGSEMSGSVHDVFVEHLLVHGPGLSQLFKIKTNAIRGGHIYNIYVRNCYIQDAILSVIQIDSNYRETVPFKSAIQYQPDVHNVYLSNIVTSPHVSIKLGLLDLASAMPSSPVRHVHFTNVTVYSGLKDLGLLKRMPLIEDYELNNVIVINPQTLQIKILDNHAYHIATPFLQLIQGNQSWDLSTDQANRMFHFNLNQPAFIKGYLIDNHTNQFTNGTLYLDYDSTPLSVDLDTTGSFKSSAFVLPVSLPSSNTKYHYVTLNMQMGLNTNSWVIPLEV